MTVAPLVSVNLVTYNHEKYIATAIRSVLGQTFEDLELVVVDDGSTDATAEVIRSFRDPRLVYLRQGNRGPGAATNAGIARCRGKYVALMSGDDVCRPDRVRKQLEEYARGGRRVLFSNVEFIDEDGQPLSQDHFASGFFEHPNLPRAKVLEKLFSGGNYLNGVTVFTEREVFPSPRPYDELLLQLQDYDLWVRLAKKYDLWIMPERLLQYRIRNHNANLSAPAPDRMIGSSNEWYLILKRFFDDLPAALFKEGFAGKLVNPDFRTEAEYLCEQALAHLGSRFPLSQLIGVEKLYHLLLDEATAGVARERYGLTLARFVEKAMSSGALAYSRRAGSRAHSLGRYSRVATGQARVRSA
jgi:glycosyltransferase involved in cell wall biosynthesis